MKFKQEHTKEARKAESGRIREKFPDRIPVICERAEKSSIVDIDKKKYLVPNDLTCGQFIYVVRRRLHLPPEQAIYLFCSNGVIPSSSSLMSSLYQDHGDPDGFLYMNYTGENVFGRP